MRRDVRKLLRPLGALLVIAVACPAALFGSAVLGCVSQGFSADCAVTGALVSPFFLLGAGIVAGLLVRGWAGLGIVWAGVVVGLVTIPLVASAGGRHVPIDPVQGVIAFFWFFTPVVIGYGVGRAVARFTRSRGAGRT